MFRGVRNVGSLSMDSTLGMAIRTLKWRKERPERTQCKIRLSVEKLQMVHRT